MKQMRIIVLLISLIIASLACNLGSRNNVSSSERIPVTTEAVETLLGRIKNFRESYQSGAEAEFTVTEAELTSLVSFEMQKQEPQPIDDVQIFLRDGQMQINGLYRDQGLSLPLKVIAQPNITEDGIFRIDLVTAQIGPVSAPDAFRDSAQLLIDEAVANGMVDQTGENFVVTGVEISDGSMTIRGNYR